MRAYYPILIWYWHILFNSIYFFYNIKCLNYPIYTSHQHHRIYNCHLPPCKLLASLTIAFASRQRTQEVQLITTKAISNILPICLNRKSIKIYFFCLIANCLITQLLHPLFKGVGEHYSIYTKISHKITTFPPTFQIFPQKSYQQLYKVTQNKIANSL